MYLRIKWSKLLFMRRPTALPQQRPRARTVQATPKLRPADHPVLPLNHFLLWIGSLQKLTPKFLPTFGLARQLFVPDVG